MLDPGTQISGYRVDAFIAAGGMGAVYRATQLSLQRVVALKVISDTLSQDPAFRARFRREAVLQAALEHPHIVTVYEAGESPSGLFIAMRYLDGATLEELVPELARGRTLELLEGIAAALDAAHTAGLVHRDVKPHNILVAGDTAYLADFGLTTASGLSSMTSAGQFLGSVDYVSPEQIRDDEPDARSDIYSFGAVVYRCLTGAVPFPRSTKVAVIYAQLEQPPQPATELAPDLPVAIDAVLARGLAKDPADRYATAGQLIREARAALAGHPSAANPPPAGAADSLTRPKSTTTAESTVRRAAAAPSRARSETAATALTLGLALLLALAAGVAGYLLHHGSGPSASASGPTVPQSADGVFVQVPTSWTARTIPVPELFGDAPTDVSVAYGPPGIARAGVVIGRSSGFGPSMLPTPLQVVPGVPAAIGPAVATRTGLEGRLYGFTNYREFTDTAGLGSATAIPARRYAILLIPTPHRDAAVACVAPAGSAAGNLFSVCPQIMSSVTVSPTALPLDPNPEYAGALSGAFRKLSQTQAAELRRAARTGSQPGQAAAFTRIASAYRVARDALHALVGHQLSAPELGLNAGLAHQLSRIAGDYSALAAAATQGDPAAYGAASDRVLQDRTVLGQRIGELGNAGYALTR